MKSILIVAIMTLLGAMPCMSSTNVFRMKKSDGGFWVTSSDGVALYNASDNSFTTFKAEEVGLTAPVNLYGIAVNGVDDVWFGSTGSYVAHYNGHDFQLFATPARMSRVVDVDTDGKLWVGASERGLMSYDGSKWETYEIESISSSLFSQGVKVDEGDGTVWSAMSNGMGEGFGYIDPEGWHSVSLASESFRDATGDSFSSLAIADDGCKWMGLYGGRVCRFINTDDYQVIDLSDREPSEMSTCWSNDVHAGPDARMWVACHHSIYAIGANGDVEETHIPLGDEDGEITCFLHDGDAIWIGTSKGGLLRWESGQLGRVNLSAGVVEITMKPDDSDAPAYDVTGRRVESVVPGNIYIKAGRKFVAR